MVVVRPGCRFVRAHRQGSLPASWPGLQGVRVWSLYPRCPESGWWKLGRPVLSLPPLQNRSPHGDSGPDGGLTLSSVFSFSEKGLETAFSARGAGWWFGKVSWRRYPTSRPFDLFLSGHLAQKWKLPAGPLGVTGLPHLELIEGFKGMVEMLMTERFKGMVEMLMFWGLCIILAAAPPHFGRG